MRPEDTQACVKRDIQKEREELPKEIYLIPDSDGEHGDYWAWCDTPAPTHDHEPEDAVKYVRADSIKTDDQAGFKHTPDKSKLSGCEHEDGSGYCTIKTLNTCRHAIPIDEGGYACEAAL